MIVQPHPRGTALPVRAIAGGRRNAISTLADGTLRVTVTAPAEKGRANRAIAAMLGKATRVPKTSIELLSGAASSRKRFVIHGRTPSEVLEALQAYCSRP